jgi:hypothetical protein
MVESRAGIKDPEHLSFFLSSGKRMWMLEPKAQNFYSLRVPTSGR